MLHIALTFVQFFSALAIIALVLLQRGKGAEAGAGFGAGASGTVFGARGAGTALSRATAILAAVFMLNSLALAYVGSRTVAAPQKTLLDTAAGKTPPAPLRGLPGAGVPPAGSTAPAPAPAPSGSAPPAAPSSAPASTGATGAGSAASTTQTPSSAAHTPAGNAPKQ